jgi:hypothetical protein
MLWTAWDGGTPRRFCFPRSIDVCLHNQELRPMRDMLERLPRLPLTADKNIDFLKTDPAVLEKLAEEAETTMRTIHAGIAAFGHLIAHSALPIESGTIGAPTLEAAGRLLAEISDLAAGCMFLATGCRTAMAFVPRRTSAQKRR